METKNTTNAVCPLAYALDQVGDRWTFLILRNAFLGIKNFNDFIKTLGIARNILSQRLNAMVENDLFYLQVSTEDARFHEYILTEKAKDLAPVFISLRMWSEKWHTNIDFAGSLLDRESGEQIEGVFFVTESKEEISADRVKLILNLEELV